MKKITLIIAFLSLAINMAFAGDIITNTNHSVYFLRNPARDASMEIDAAYTNPAGLAFLTDGLHLSFTNQSVFQTRSITSTFAPFAAYGGSATKVYEADLNSITVPSIQFAYKKNSWAVSGEFAVAGGGAKANFNKGLPSFEAPVAMIPVSLNAKGITTSAYSMDCAIEGHQLILSLQVNATYKFSESFSGALGFRVNSVSNGYKGHLNDIQINPQHPLLNPTGGMMSANTFFTNAATAATGAASSLQPVITAGYGSLTMATLVANNIITAAQLTQLSTGLGTDVSSLQASQVQGLYNTAAATYTAGATSTANKSLDATQSGWGVAPIVSLDYHTEKLNVAARYEFRSSIDVTNKTTVDNTGLYPDKAKTANDVPAYLAVGAEYKITNKWKVSGGYHHFFDSDAKMANNKQQYINGGVNEYLFGSEYQINDKFLVSAGTQITRTGVTDAYQSDLSNSLNSYSIGLGGAVNLTAKLKLSIAYLLTIYSDWSKVSTNYNGTSLAGTDVYGRTSNVFGLGLDYKF